MVWSHLKKGVETDKEVFLPNDIALDGGNSVRLQSVLYTSFISMKQGMYCSFKTKFLITKGALNSPLLQGQPTWLFEKIDRSPNW